MKNPRKKLKQKKKKKRKVKKKKRRKELKKKKMRLESMLLAVVEWEEDSAHLEKIPQ